MYFNFISEINIFNKLLIFTWHDISFVLKVPLNDNQPTSEVQQIHCASTMGACYYFCHHKASTLLYNC